jgi:hypothetical protein
MFSTSDDCLDEKPTMARNTEPVSIPQLPMAGMFRTMKRLARKGAGYAMITAGTVMIFIPGPGLLAIAGGLALLSEDVEWAGRVADWLKQKVGRRPSDADDQDGG